MFAKLKESVLTYLFGTVCPHCGVRNKRNSGYYTRAWNHRCNQAAGSFGFYCYACRNVEFLQTYEDWIKDCSPWIAPYDQPPKGYEREHNTAPSGMVKFPDPKTMSRKELEQKYAEACSLLDDCYDVVSLWDVNAPSQILWKQSWLEKARGPGASHLA